MLSEEILTERAAAEFNKSESDTSLRHKGMNKSNAGAGTTFDYESAEKSKSLTSDKEVILTTLTLANNVIEQQSKLINSYEAIVDAITGAKSNRRN